MDLNAGTLLVDHDALEPWKERIQATLRASGVQYGLIAQTHMVGLAMVVYAKRTLAPAISDVRTTTVGVGIMGVGGNKGAVIARFNVHDTSICIVNCHLAAHQHNVKGRNSDFLNIVKKTNLLPPNAGNGSQTSTAWSGYRLSDHDFVFWIGDLNYRVNIPDFDRLVWLIEMKDWPSILAQDQLVQEKAAGNAFVEFFEGPITFPPTYKYVVGTSEYDSREKGGKRRLPAWCDRIQWRVSSGREEECTQKLYSRAELTLSDHKPVMALFDVQARDRKSVV